MQPARDDSSKVLALDFGMARTGMALTDASGLIARPAGFVKRASTSAGLARIAEVIAHNDIETVVVGLPVGLDGSETTQTRRARSFAAQLRQYLGQNSCKAPEIVMYDERLTTRMAEQTIRVNSKQNEVAETGKLDSVAACHILTGWLAKNRH